MEIDGEEWLKRIREKGSSVGRNCQWTLCSLAALELKGGRWNGF